MSKTLTVYLAADLKKFNQGMDDAGRKASGLGQTMSGMLGPALIGAAAAAGAFALKIGVDGVKAAIEDEAAAAKLAKTLENVGQAHNTDAVEEYIGSLERSLGVADDELRPAYDRLIRSVGDTEEANRMLALSLDISAGTGKSLQTVVEALGKAYDGNTGGLARLGAGIDSAVLKTGDMQAITSELAKTFAGQAKTSANTYQGQLARLQIGVDNLAEAFGYGLLNSMGDTQNQTDTLMDAMEDLEPVVAFLGEEVAKTATNMSSLIEPLSNVAELAGEATGQSNFLSDAFTFVTNKIFPLKGGLETAATVMGSLSGKTDLADESVRNLTSNTVLAAIEAGKAETAFTDLTPVIEENGKTALTAAGSYQSLYEKIAAADRLARDLAGTSGTVSSAIGAGIRNPQSVASEQARNAAINETNLAQAISAIVSRTDARTGRPRISLPPFLVAG